MANIQKFVANNQRIFKKTLSYYIMHITVAMIVAYFVTGNLWMAVTLSLLEPTVQTFAFFFHERIWETTNRTTEENIHAYALISSAPSTLQNITKCSFFILFQIQ